MAVRYAPKITVVDSGGELRGVITDWGGVLSTPVLATVRAWVQADGIDWDSYRAVMRPWVSQAYDSDGSPNPIHALERGECSGAEFEEILAARPGVLHTETAATARALQDLLGVPLAWSAPAT